MVPVKSCQFDFEELSEEFATADEGDPREIFELVRKPLLDALVVLLGQVNAQGLQLAKLGVCEAIEHFLNVSQEE